MPIDASRYPKDWKIRSRFVRFYRAKNRCEWCGAENYKPHPVTGSKVVLTTAHVYDKRPEKASLLNLAALCQRCHLAHDRQDKLDDRAGAIEPKNCREFVRKRALEIGHGKVAAMLGYSPSILTRKLRSARSDSSRFTCDDLERYVETTDDVAPVMYLVDRYAPEIRPQLIGYLERKLAALKSASSQMDLFQ